MISAKLKQLIDLIALKKKPPRLAKGHQVEVRLPFLSATAIFEISGEIDRYRIQERGGEDAIVERFADLIGYDHVVYDLGAQLGLFSIVASIAAPQGKVIAFEPDPDIRRQLERHIALNGKGNVLVLPYAIANESGAETLYTDGLLGFSPSLKKQSREGACRGTIEVQVRSLDDLVYSGEIPPPDVVKIDIEGAEFVALTGMRRLLKEQPPKALLIELHPQFLVSFNSTAEDCVNLLKDAGYSIESVSNRSAETHIICRR